MSLCSSRNTSRRATLSPASKAEDNIHVLERATLSLRLKEARQRFPYHTRDFFESASTFTDIWPVKRYPALVELLWGVGPAGSAVRAVVPPKQPSTEHFCLFLVIIEKWVPKMLGKHMVGVLKLICGLVKIVKSSIY